MASGTARADRFLEHLEPLRGPLEGYCRRSLADRNSIADVLQSAVANAFRDFDLYAEGTNFRAWIFAYVHREILNANRKYWRSRGEALPVEFPARDSGGLSDELPSGVALLEDPEGVLDQCDSLIAEKVRDLPEQERAVLLLQAIGEFKYREIADILDIPIGTVMSSLARCRAKLRRLLDDYAREQGLLKPEV